MKVKEVVEVLGTVKRDAAAVYVDRDGNKCRLTSRVCVDDGWDQLSIVAETAYTKNGIPKVFIPEADAEQLRMAIDHEYRNCDEEKSLFSDLTEFRDFDVYVCTDIQISDCGGSCWSTNGVLKCVVVDGEFMIVDIRDPEEEESNE